MKESRIACTHIKSQKQIQILLRGRYCHTRQGSNYFLYSSYVMFGIQSKIVDRKQGITTQKLTEIRADRKSQQKIQIIQLSDTDFKLLYLAYSDRLKNNFKN